MNCKLKMLYDDVFNHIINNQRHHDIIKCIQILLDRDVAVGDIMEYLDKYYDIEGMDALKCIEKARLYAYYESDNICDYYLCDYDMTFHTYINDLIDIHRHDYLQDNTSIDYIVDMLIAHS